MKMHREVLGKDGIVLLRRLNRILGGHYYLAGGTGLAIQSGHRKSADLDYFRHAPSLVMPGRDKLKGDLASLGRYRMISEDEGTLHLMIAQIRVSILAYRASLLREVVPFEEGRLASPVDIGLMKLSAIIGRGSKKDFIDMACIIKRYVGLSLLLDMLPKKFPEAKEMALTALKALAYFKDAEVEPDPVILDDEYAWPAVREYIAIEVKKAAEKRLRG